MVYCDLNENILEWGSEEIVIPYRSPIDNRVHRYFPDFYVKLKETTGKIKKYIIEVKPKKQLKPPVKPKRQTKGYLREAYEMLVIKQNGKLPWNTVKIVYMNLK